MTNDAEYERFLELVKRRHSTRQFLSDPVPDEHVSAIIEAARWAPSAFHTQPWEFVVINEATTRNRVISALEKLGPPIKDPAKEKQVRKSFKDAPVFIFQLCDWRASVGLPENTAADSARVKDLYNSSMANAFLYMHLAAAALGLASQWYTTTSRPDVEKALRDIIGIPDALTIYDMMVLGYPAASPQDDKIIRPLDEMVHYNACGPDDFRTDEAVADYAEKTKAWCLAQH